MIMEAPTDQPRWRHSILSTDFLRPNGGAPALLVAGPDCLSCYGLRCVREWWARSCNPPLDPVVLSHGIAERLFPPFGQDCLGLLVLLPVEFVQVNTIVFHRSAQHYHPFQRTAILR